METIECNEATFPSWGHRDSPPSLSLSSLYAATRLHSSTFLCSFFAASSTRLFSIIFLSAASHRNSSTSIPCLQAWSQCRSTAQNHRAVEGSAKTTIVTKQKNHARCHMTQTSIPHHLVNAALTKCRLKCKIGTHPIPLPIRVLFIELGYLTRIAAKAHRH